MRLWRLSLALATMVKPPSFHERPGGFFSPARGRWPRLPAGDLVPPVEAVKLLGLVPPVPLADQARAGRDFLFIFSSVKVLAENHK